MKSRAPNRLEQALAAGARDLSRREGILRVLNESTLWFPVDGRPGQPPVVQPRPGEHLAVWICQDDNGIFTPAFTARDVLKEAMTGRPQRYTTASMIGRDYCAAMARQERPVVLNPSSQWRLRLALEALHGLASGDIFKPAETRRMSLRTLTPAQLPSALVQTAFDECHAEPDILGLWLGDTAEGPEAPVDLKTLHAVVWVRDAARTSTDELALALKRCLGGGSHVEMIRFDEAGSPDALTAYRQFPAFYTRPAAPPG